MITASTFFVLLAFCLFGSAMSTMTATPTTTPAATATPSTLPVYLTVTNVGGRKSAVFTVAECDYSAISYPESNGDVPVDNNGGTPNCGSSPPAGLPPALYINGGTDANIWFDIVPSFTPAYTCTETQATPDAAIYTCSPIPYYHTIASTTTTTTTTTKSTATATSTVAGCITITNVFGKSNGNGYLGDCCKTSNDCYGSCIKGVCDADNNPKTTTTKGTKTSSTTTTSSTTKTSSASPTSTGSCTNKSNVNGQKMGNGVLGECCRNSLDCTGSCVNGACDADGNPSSGSSSCTSSNYYGKNNGRGPAGVCCKTEGDCLDDCTSGTCTK